MSVNLARYPKRIQRQAQNLLKMSLQDYWVTRTPKMETILTMHIDFRVVKFKGYMMDNRQNKTQTLKKALFCRARQDLRLPPV